MSASEIGVMIGAATPLLIAAGAGIYRLWRDARKDRAEAIETAKAEALAQARLEATVAEATRAVEQLKHEAATKDATIAKQRSIIAQLTQGRDSA